MFHLRFFPVWLQIWLTPVGRGNACKKLFNIFVIITVSMKYQLVVRLYPAVIRHIILKKNMTSKKDWCHESLINHHNKIFQISYTLITKNILNHSLSIYHFISWTSISVCVCVCWRLLLFVILLALCNGIFIRSSTCNPL